MNWRLLSRLSVYSTKTQLRQYTATGNHQLSNLDNNGAILEQFPEGIQMAFAYGSGVFKQQGQSDTQVKKNMIDLIFVVDDSYKWHHKNIKQNKNHYSCLKYFGAKQVANVKRNMGRLCISIPRFSVLEEKSNMESLAPNNL